MADPLRYGMTLPNGQPLRWNMGPQFVWGGNVPNNLQPPQQMQQNDISIIITQAAEDAILAKAAELRALVQAFAVNLTDEQRARYFKLGDARMAFDEACDMHLHNRPDLVPPNVSLAEYDKDGDAIHRVRRLRSAFTGIDTMLGDTEIVLGSDRMDVNLKFYNYLELGDRVGLAGAGAIHDELKPIYPGRRSPRTPATPLPPHA